MPSVRIAVHVTPRAVRDEVCGWRADELSVRVTAPPDDGKANAAVSRLVADSLGVPKSAVSVLRGHTSRHKLLAIEDVPPERVGEVFGSPSR